MTSPLTGIHHVTAFAKDPVANHRFYTGALGLRMVKKTVNFDDPLTYHLYYGDERGRPGTLLTHFPHPSAKRGTHGSPEIIATRLRVAPGSLDDWAARLASHGVHASVVEEHGERRLAFADHDAMRLALVEDESAASETGGDEPIRGIEGVVVHVPDPEATEGFLSAALGFRAAESPASARRLVVGDGAAGRRIELVESPVDPSTAMGAGTVHHVAWRVPDDATQAGVARAVEGAGIPVTPVMDRQYFRSIYFRVPGGVVFEVATDGPGFDVDEPMERLGTGLRLPPQFEARREEITARLVPIG